MEGVEIDIKFCRFYNTMKEKLNNLISTFQVLSSEQFLKKRRVLTMAIIDMTIESTKNLKDEIIMDIKSNGKNENNCDLLGKVNGFLIRLNTYKNINAYGDFKRQFFEL